MAIKFGDTLENQNSNYPIVDASGNNVKGLVIPTAWDDSALGAIPAAKRAIGSLGVDLANGKVYVYTGTNTSDGTNGWNDADGTGWKQAGSTTIGTPSDEDWTDGNPAITGWSESTTIADALDGLNELLGALVPSPPATWASTYTGYSDFDDIHNGNNSDGRVRLVGYTSGGGSVTHQTNGNTVTASPGTVVNWLDSGTASSTYSQSWTTTANNLEKTAFTFSFNDIDTTLESADDTFQQTLAASNPYGGNLQITVNHANFPLTGDSAGFYQGVNAFAITAQSVSSQGFHRFSIGANSSFRTKVMYRTVGGSAASINESGLTMTNEGTGYYLSGIPHFTTPTWSITLSASNVIPANALVYGTVDNDPTDYDCFQGSSSSWVNSPGTLQYDDIPGNSSNTAVRQASAFNSHVKTNIAGKSGVIGAVAFNSSNGPTGIIRSIHGNSSTATFTTASTATHLFFDEPNISQSSSNMYVIEDDLYNGLHSSNTAGYRVTDPDGSGSAVETPDDATTSYVAWNRQYCNGSAALSIKDQDAITRAATGTAIRCKYEDGDLSSSAFNYVGSSISALDFSGRTTAAQYVTYVFPCDANVGQFTLKFKGDLTSTGNCYIKIFDSGQTFSWEDTNSATSGWVSPTEPYAGSGVAGAGGTGCAASGTDLDKTETTLQTTLVTAGQARFGNGSDGLIYIRFKLPAGAYIEQLGITA